MTKPKNRKETLMSQLTVKQVYSNKTVQDKEPRFYFDEFLLKETRLLKPEEISVLKKNGNKSQFDDWSNLRVSVEEDGFCPELVKDCEFRGMVVLGLLRPASLKYHDLELDCGLYNSYIESCAIGNDVCVRNVKYLVNYVIGNRVILFNIDEMTCTVHSKFGNGILKKEESEDVRIKIGVANENDGRYVLPFESMISADAYIWSRRRGDKLLMKRFVELTEQGNERNKDTCGSVADDSVIKNTVLIKDAKIGSHAYIKGAFKLKNITVCSSEQEPSQIGEGVEMVNGILGHGSKVFYQAVAVRFVIGRNCQLKYGVRLLNSVLGDNSTVSCCELLNNLIFPFHEQHHNSSFLIATTILGQSNIAAGATIGSNHNSRSPDGEIYAGRGFWPGLCSDFKHNSKFASFSLVAKGSYQNELNITYPFSLVGIDSTEQAIHIIPAYWFLYNMFAIARNNSKFKKRDKRVVKEQHIETDPLAPDTMQEVLLSLDRLIELTGRTLHFSDRQQAKDYLHRNPDSDIVLEDPQVQKRFGGKIYKPAQGYCEYRKILKYFATKSLLEYCAVHGLPKLTPGVIEDIKQIPLFVKWENAGGQVVPSEKIDELASLIKDGSVNTWQEVHSFYDKCQQDYPLYKARYSLYILEQLYSRPIVDFTSDIFANVYADVLAVSNNMYESSIVSRQKDYTDFFRAMTYENEDEMTAVLGTVEGNDFLQQLEKDTRTFNARLEVFFADYLV